MFASIFCVYNYQVHTQTMVTPFCIDVSAKPVNLRVGKQEGPGIPAQVIPHIALLALSPFLVTHIFLV